MRKWREIRPFSYFITLYYSQTNNLTNNLLVLDVSWLENSVIADIQAGRLKGLLQGLGARLGAKDSFLRVRCCITDNLKSMIRYNSRLFHRLTWMFFQQMKRIHSDIFHKPTNGEENFVLGALAAAASVCGALFHHFPNICYLFNI